MDDATHILRRAFHVRCRRGFTLVELLVVIGIIAILISMLLPAISTVQQQVQSAKCLSNLRQIGIAISTYANDHNFCLVPGDYVGLADGFTQAGAGNWADILADQGYISTPIGKIGFPGDNLATFSPSAIHDNILMCPTFLDDDVVLYNYPASQTDPIGMMWFARGSDITLDAVKITYGVNCARDQESRNLRPLPFNCLPDQNGKSMDWRINKFSQFTDDSILPLVFDGVWMFNDDPARINARHNNRTQTNLLFADYHCETQLTSTLPNDNWYLQ